MGAPPRVGEGELRQLETGELVRALARASPGDEDVPAILCKHMPDTGLVADTNEPRRLPALAREKWDALEPAWRLTHAVTLRQIHQARCRSHNAAHAGTSYASGTQATGKPPHGGAYRCLHQSSPAAAGLLVSYLVGLPVGVLAERSGAV